jgi:DNA polymerase-3 subunit beta
MAPESFPSLPKFDDVAFFAVDPKVLRLMIDMALPSVSTDETRHNLCGVYVEPAANSATGLRMVATDGHRLAVVERPLKVAPVMSSPEVLPRKGLGEAKKLLDAAGEGEVRLGFVANSAVVEAAGMTMTMRLVDGKFPDYQQVIPASWSRKAIVSRAELMAAIKRVSLLGDKDDGVRLSFEYGTLGLYSNNPDRGEATDEIAAECTGEPLKIGVSARYMLDALGACGDEKPTLELTDELSPLVVRSASAAPGESALFVVMPRRL